MNDIQAMPREIQLLEQAAAFLAECQDLDEVKSLRDKAEALRLYSKKIGDSQRAQNAAAEIKIRAERRMGELLKAMPKQGGGRPLKTGSTMEPVSPPLADLGIAKTQSHRTQAIADVPEEEFEEVIAKAKEADRPLTSNEFYQKGQTHRRTEQKRADLKAKAKPSPNDKPANWEIHENDCIKALSSIESRSARLIFADPPYNIGLDYGDHYDDSRPADEFQRWCQEWLAESFRVLSDDGSLWILVNHEWAWVLCYEAIETTGFYLRQWITWYESFGVNCTGMFNRCSRALLWLVKDADRFVFNAEAHEIRRPSDRQEKYNDNRANPAGKLWDDVWGVNPPIPRVVGTAKERLPDFPTQLPLALLRPIVACASNPGDLVIDPFSGSATTGAACIELGRRFIGIELSPKFVELSRLRLAGIEAPHAV